MLSNFVGICILATLPVGLSLAAVTAKSQTALTSAQIIDKNVAARGGLRAWRAVQTLSLEGKMGAGGNQRATLTLPMADPKQYGSSVPHRPAEEAQLPFLMEMQRPRKVRVELKLKGETAVQVYDGTNGWKVRPFLNRPAVEPFSAQELKAASNQEDLDGPLVDYAAKGSRIELVGTEKVAGRDTYKLRVTEKNGHTFQVWIDAGTFLEAKMEGQPRRLDGTDHPVEIYYGDFRSVDGLVLPFLMETRVLPVKKNALNLKDTPVPPEQIIVEKVVVNPKLDTALFSRPELAVASRSK